MALTPQEEKFLKQLARDHAPMRVQNPPSKTFHAVVRDERLADDPALGRKDPKMRVHDISDDPEIERRVKHVLRPGEKLGQFYARTLLGRAEILSMSKDEIQRFSDHADENNRDLAIPHSDLRFPQGRQSNVPIVLLP